jgi:hypothetical protein
MLLRANDLKRLNRQGAAAQTSPWLDIRRDEESTPLDDPFRVPAVRAVKMHQSHRYVTRVGYNIPSRLGIIRWRGGVHRDVCSEVEADISTKTLKHSKLKVWAQLHYSVVMDQQTLGSIQVPASFALRPRTACRACKARKLLKR